MGVENIYTKFQGFVALSEKVFSLSSVRKLEELRSSSNALSGRPELNAEAK